MNNCFFLILDKAPQKNHPKTPLKIKDPKPTSSSSQLDKITEPPKRKTSSKTRPASESDIDTNSSTDIDIDSYTTRTLTPHPKKSSDASWDWRDVEEVKPDW